MRKAPVIALVTGVLTAAAFAGPKDIQITLEKDLKWNPISPAGDKGPQVAVVFGDLKAKGKPIGFILKVPPGFKPGPHTHTSDYWGTVIQGTMHDWKTPGTDEGPGIGPAGSWFQPGGQPHDNDCEASSKDGCLTYVYSPGGFDFKPVEDKKSPKK